MLFKKTHNYGGCYVVREIGNDFKGVAKIVFICKGVDVGFKDVSVYDDFVVIGGEGIVKDGDKVFVDFDKNNETCSFAEVLGHGSYAGTNLKDAVIFGYVGTVDYSFENVGVYKKVLSEFLLKIKVIFFQHF